MPETIAEKAGELVVERCWCGIQHAVPRNLVEKQRREHEENRPQTAIYCPLGHTWVRSGPSKAKQLEQQVARERAWRDQAEARAREERERRARTERQLSAQRGVTTRIKNRVAKGVCPCCNRHFENLQRHMATQHPGYEHTAPDHQEVA